MLGTCVKAVGYCERVMEGTGGNWKVLAGVGGCWRIRWGGEGVGTRVKAVAAEVEEEGREVNDEEQEEQRRHDLGDGRWFGVQGVGRMGVRETPLIRM